MAFLKARLASNAWRAARRVVVAWVDARAIVSLPCVYAMTKSDSDLPDAGRRWLTSSWGVGLRCVAMFPSPGSGNCLSPIQRRGRDGQLDTRYAPEYSRVNLA